MGSRSHNFNTARHAMQSIGLSSHDGSLGQQHHLACIGWLCLSMERKHRIRCSLHGASQQVKLLAEGPSCPGRSATASCRSGRTRAAAAPRSRARRRLAASAWAAVFLQLSLLQMQMACGLGCALMSRWDFAVYLHALLFHRINW